MSQADMVIDGLEFARRHDRLSGRLPLEALPRLGEELFDPSGSLGYEVRGESAGEGDFLLLELDGVLRLTCQRCLGPLEFALHLSSRLRLVPPGCPWPADDQTGGLEDEACDAIEAADGLDLADLMEEEILLALPISPRHERCELPAAGQGQRQDSPFAPLARLKRAP